MFQWLWPIILLIAIVSGCEEREDPVAASNEPPNSPIASPEGQTVSPIVAEPTSTATGQPEQLIADDSLQAWRDIPNPFIVFMSKVDSDKGELYLRDKRGEVTRLTDNDRHDNNPAVSPGGTKIAYHVGDEGNPLTWEVYVMDLETRVETRLTNNGVIDGHPDWSPSGEEIVFASFQDDDGNPSGTADIYVMDLAGNVLRQLTDTQWEDNDPEWSPDGTMIAFKSTRNTKESYREEIYVMDSDGSNVRRLSTTSGWESDHDPSWSPDSRWISYMRYGGTRPWIDIGEVIMEELETVMPWTAYKVDVEANVVQLTAPEHMTTLPIFSSDGRKILYTGVRFTTEGGRIIRADHKLVIIDPDGSNPQQLIPDDIFVHQIGYIDW